MNRGETSIVEKESVKKLMLKDIMVRTKEKQISFVLICNATKRMISKEILKSACRLSVNIKYITGKKRNVRHKIFTEDRNENDIPNVLL